jgi:hypothetical protein
MLQNLTNSVLDNIIMSMNSSNSTKKEKINNNHDSRYSNPKNSINSLTINPEDNNKSPEILNNLLKGIISLKKNDFFDYIIKMLKIMLHYKRNNIDNGNIGSNNLFDINIEDNNYLDLLYQNIFISFSKETIVRNILLKDFNKNKIIFKKKLNGNKFSS